MLRRAFMLTAIVVSSSVLAACGGGGATSVAPPPIVPQSVATQSTDIAVGTSSSTQAIALDNGFSGSLSLHAASASATKLELMTATATPGRATIASASATCPAIPPIVLSNPFPFSISIGLEAFMVRLPCTPSATLYGASYYQSSPVPATLTVTKIADASVNGRKLQFTPTGLTLTFPARSTITIDIAAESSTSAVQVPVVANQQVPLTPAAAPSGAPAIPQTLAIESSAVAGGAFSSACYAPGTGPDPSPGDFTGFLGKQEFYCVLSEGAPGIASTFGSASSNVNFQLTNPNPDRVLVHADGPVTVFPCSATSNPAVLSCSGQVGQTFSTSVYSKVSVNNEAPLQACVAQAYQSGQVDCLGVDGVTAQPAATSVPAGNEVELLVADDPTFAPPAYGSFSLSVSSASYNGGKGDVCAINTGIDNPVTNPDIPLHYTDPTVDPGSTGQNATYTGVGPYAGLDLNLDNPGTCTVTVSEYFPSSQPAPVGYVPQSVTYSLTVGSYAIGESRIRRVPATHS